MKASTQARTNSVLSGGERFILAQTSEQTLAISSTWVAEIIRVDKSKILSLPFYQDLVLGITHHDGKVLPLLSTHLLLGQSPQDIQEISTVVRLRSVASNLVEVGLVVDRVNRSVFQSELSETAVIFSPQMMPSDLWQPLH